MPEPMIGETFQIGANTLTFDYDGEVYYDGHRLHASAPSLEGSGIDWTADRNVIATQLARVYGPFIAEKAAIPVGLRHLYLVL